MVNKQLTAKFLPKVRPNKVTPIASLGGNNLFLPNRNI